MFCPTSDVNAIQVFFLSAQMINNTVLLHCRIRTPFIEQRTWHLDHGPFRALDLIPPKNVTGRPAWENDVRTFSGRNTICTWRLSCHVISGRDRTLKIKTAQMTINNFNYDNLDSFSFNIRWTNAFSAEFHVVAASHVHTLIGKFLTCSWMRLKFFVHGWELKYHLH